MKVLIISLLSGTMILMACKNREKPGSDADLKKSDETAELQRREAEISQEEKIQVHPVEHASTVISWNEVLIFIDPVGGAGKYENYGEADLILITDVHGDHFDLETLEGLETSNSKIMMPRAVADRMPAVFTPQIDVLNNGDTKERFGITVEAIPMYNLREEARKFHEKGRGNGYLLQMGGKRLYFSGDTEDIPEMRQLKDIDMAFICMNLPYTMTVESAADAVLEFKPARVYPYHYRGRPDISDVGAFRNLVEAGNKDIEVIQLDWYPNDEF